MLRFGFCFVLLIADFLHTAAYGLTQVFAAACRAGGLGWEVCEKGWWHNHSIFTEPCGFLAPVFGMSLGKGISSNEYWEYGLLK